MSQLNSSPGLTSYCRLEAAVDEVLGAIRVLFVDDNTLSCRIGHRLLSSLGASVECATSGEEALALAELSEFDLIVLDCVMPGMSGFDVAKQLRQPGSRAEGTPIVALTAGEAQGVRQLAREAGMENVLCKPFCTESMIEVLKLN